jgi:hypothetical protein
LRYETASVVRDFQLRDFQATANAPPACPAWGGVNADGGRKAAPMRVTAERWKQKVFRDNRPAALE